MKKSKSHNESDYIKKMYALYKEIKKLVGNNANITLEFSGLNCADNKANYELNIQPKKPIIKENKIIGYENWGLAYNDFSSAQKTAQFLKALKNGLDKGYSIKTNLTILNFLETRDTDKFIDDLAEEYKNNDKIESIVNHVLFAINKPRIVKSMIDEIKKATKELDEGKFPEFKKIKSKEDKDKNNEPND